MALDPTIALSAKAPAFNNPFEILGQMQQLQQQRQVIASNQALEEERRQKIAKEVKDEQVRNRFFGIISTSRDADEAQERIRAEAPEMYHGFIEQRQKIDKVAEEIKKASAETERLQGEIASKGQDYAAPFMHMVEKSGYNPDVFNFAIGTISRQFPNFPVDQLRQQATGGPEAIKQIVQGFKSTAQQNADVNAETAAAELPGKQADSATRQQVLAGMRGGLTPDQLRQQAAQQATAAQAAETAAETKRAHLAQESIERAKNAQTAGDKTDLTPEGLDAAAMMFAKTGQLPALGMGDKTTRKAIINRAAQMTPGLDVASAKADFSANQSSLAALQKQRDAISSFEQTASKNIDIFLETAGKVFDSGSPLINTPVRALTGRMLGSANQAEYDAARQVAVNEVAKITGNPNLSGQLSDAARKEVEAFNPQNATLKQTVAVMRLLKKDMANRAGSMDDQIAAIKGRIGKSSGQTDSDAKTVKMRAPNGQERDVPAAEVEHYKARGAKVVP